MANKAIANKKSDNTVEKKKQANVIKKDYILNDLEALKKKMANKKRSPEIGIYGEAVNGACTTIGMKTSLFEYSKAFMMEEIGKDARITQITPVAKVVADTIFHGEADIEYQLEIQFKVEENVHKVKVFCYTTTCNLLIQNMGGKHELKSYLNNQHVAKFFADQFIIPFGRKALASNAKIDDQYIPNLRRLNRTTCKIIYDLPTSKQHLK